jgi:hypothetical protein
VSWREIALHHDWIAELVGVVPVSVIHQRLAGEQGLEASVASVRRYVRGHFPDGPRSEEVRMSWPRVPPEPRRRRITGIRGCGRTRRRAGAAGYGRFRWCCRTRGTCSSAQW